VWIQKVAGGAVELLAYSPDGSTLYTSDAGAWITAWDIATHTGKRLFNLRSLALGSPDEMSLADNGNLLLVLGSRHDWLVWDVTARVEHSRITLKDNEFGIKFDPRGTSALRVSRKGLRQWDVRTRKNGPELARWQLDNGIYRIDITADRRRAAILTFNHEVRIADFADGKRPYKLKLPAVAGYFSPNLNFSPDGNTLILFDNAQAFLWDVPTRRVRTKVLWKAFRWRKIAFHPTAPVFAGCNHEGVFTLFNLETGEPINSLDFALGQTVRCAAFASDGLTCAVGGSNRQFAIFDVDL
jgi:WD40 repeat protein